MGERLGDWFLRGASSVHSDPSAGRGRPRRAAATALCWRPEPGASEHWRGHAGGLGIGTQDRTLRCRRGPAARSQDPASVHTRHTPPPGGPRPRTTMASIICWRSGVISNSFQVGIRPQTRRLDATAAILQAARPKQNAVTAQVRQPPRQRFSSTCCREPVQRGCLLRHAAAPGDRKFLLHFRFPPSAAA